MNNGIPAVIQIIHFVCAFRKNVFPFRSIGVQFSNFIFVMKLYK